ncbi:MAG: ferrochelatase [Propionibacterium sp.]|nr:ferrochelatase [Propionibacterium sp.]
MPGTVTLLVNTGTPESPDKAAVKEYLLEFLNDPYMIGMPDAVRRVLVNRVIVPGRVSGSAARYRDLFAEAGGRSPLAVHSEALAAKLSERLDHPVLPFMRYGQPGIEEVAGVLAGAEEIVIAPLFPQETYSSYASAAEYAIAEVSARFPDAKLRVLRPYYDHPGYIDALATSMRPYFSDAYDLVVISFHSIPLSHQIRGARAGMDYQQQCRTTAHLLAKAVGVPDEKLRVTFQSAIKPMKWLGPALETESVVWAKAGVERVLVVCPGFAVDCLETVYDIGSKQAKIFTATGGTEFALVPALNAQDHWAQTLASMLRGDRVQPLT